MLKFFFFGGKLCYVSYFSLIERLLSKDSKLIKAMSLNLKNI